MSISEKQLLANRANAQKSTGPKTDPGKEASSRNAIKHGLYSDTIIINSPNLKEDQSEYDLLLSSLYDDLRPQTLFQEHLVQKIANALWRSRRLIAAETAQINHQLDGGDGGRFYIRGLGVVYNIDDPAYKSVPAEAKERAIANQTGINTIPNDSFNANLLRYEMRLDRQLTNTYKLLRNLQNLRGTKIPQESDDNI
jgi:hypothetical protein